MILPSWSPFQHVSFVLALNTHRSKISKNFSRMLVFKSFCREYYKFSTTVWRACALFLSDRDDAASVPRRGASWPSEPSLQGWQCLCISSLPISLLALPARSQPLSCSDSGSCAALPRCLWFWEADSSDGPIHECFHIRCLHSLQQVILCLLKIDGKT